MNRFYKPSAPRYTSQFVEETMPFDLMLQVGQQKIQQKASFASNIGEFQGLIAATPNGERTADGAPVVRNRWANRLNEWATSSMDKYDTPQAISDLARMRMEFINDSDLALMRRDAEEGDKERQMMRTKMEMGDIDPNVNPLTGKTKQFHFSFENYELSEGKIRNPDPYKGYDPLIKFQDVPQRIYEEFKLVPTVKRGFSDQVVDIDPVTEEPVTRTVHRTIDVTNMDEWNDQLENMAIRGVEDKEDWARYQNEYIKSRTGKPWTKEQWKEYLKPFARKMIVDQDVDVSTWNTPGGSGTGTEGPLGKGVGFHVMGTSSPEKTIAPVNEVRMMSREKYYEHPENWSGRMKAFDTLLREQVPEYDSMTNDEKEKKMKEYIEQMEYPVQYDYSWWGADVEQNANAFVASMANDEGVIIKPVGATILNALSMWNLDTGKMIEKVNDKQNMLQEGNSIRMIGTVPRDKIALQVAPGTVIADIYNGKSNETITAAIKLPDLEKEDKELWNWFSFERAPTTGVGSMFAMDVPYNQKTNQLGEITYHDVSDSGTEGEWKNVNPQYKNGLYVIPRRNMNTGQITYRVFDQNPSEINYLDDSDPKKNHLIGVYDYSDFTGTGVVDENGQPIHPVEILKSQIIYDAYINKQ